MRLTATLALLLTLLACAPRGPGLEDLQELDSAALEERARSLEQQRRERPRDVGLRLTLGQAYYLLAREALDHRKDEAGYLAYFERSIDEFVTALELDPRRSEPHLFLATIDLYRGKPRAALRGLNNSKRLSNSPIAYTNIAEMYVYRGKPGLARDWNQLGLKKGAPWGPVTFNDMLIAWRENDLRGARRYFDDLERYEPEMLRTINMARLPEAPKSFRSFAGYCCASPGCGPYMEEPCAELSLAVGKRDLSEEAILKELRLEMEARRRLRKVYEQRKELDVTIEAPAEE